MHRKATLTACIIARDEQQQISSCLRSVAFCDQIVVVDSGSTDRTREIARAAGALVVENPWPGFAAQRNVALDHATGDWILEVDCDERVSDGLREEIERLLSDPPARSDVGLLPIRHWLLGRPLGPSAKNHYNARLFRRGSYRHDESRKVHEGLTPMTAPWVATHPIEHCLADTLHEAVHDTWRYAYLEAEQVKPPAGVGAYVRGILVRPAIKFLFRLFFHSAWRDGWRGVLKVWLDCGYDARVWWLVLQRRRRRPTNGNGGHFGARATRAGTARIVALAAGVTGAAEAAQWLERAASEGADAILVTDAPPAASDDVRVRTVRRISPLNVLRALDHEAQLRSIDAVVPFGRRERLALRSVPATLLASPLELSPDIAPLEAARRALAAREPP